MIYLELVLEQVLLVGELAVHAEQALLVRRHGLWGYDEPVCAYSGGRGRSHVDVDLVLLVWVHDCGSIKVFHLVDGDGGDGGCPLRLGEAFGYKQSVVRNRAKLCAALCFLASKRAAIERGACAGWKSAKRKEARSWALFTKVMSSLNSAAVCCQSWGGTVQTKKSPTTAASVGNGVFAVAS